MIWQSCIFALLVVTTATLLPLSGLHFDNRKNSNIKMGTINNGKSKRQAYFTGSVTGSNWYWGEISDERLMTGECL
jgi:hypothetical protein